MGVQARACSPSGAYNSRPATTGRWGCGWRRASAYCVLRNLTQYAIRTIVKMNTRQPEPQDNPARTGFWESRYIVGNTGWDIGQPAPPFVDLLSGTDAPAPGSMIVPGCGRGHDAIFFAKHGFTVVGVDFAASAIADARAAAQV